MQAPAPGTPAPAPDPDPGGGGAGFSQVLLPDPSLHYPDILEVGKGGMHVVSEPRNFWAALPPPNLLPTVFCGRDLKQGPHHIPRLSGP